MGRPPLPRRRDSASAARANFATQFAFWDWLFGTARLPRVKPSGYGIVELFPAGYLAQQIHVFKPRPTPEPAATSP